jgi:hypothetical protein
VVQRDARLGDSSRIVISLRLISSEKMALVMPCLMDADGRNPDQIVTYRSPGGPRR